MPKYISINLINQVYRVQRWNSPYMPKFHGKYLLCSKMLHMYMWCMFVTERAYFLWVISVMIGTVRIYSMIPETPEITHFSPAC